MPAKPYVFTYRLCGGSPMLRRWRAAVWFVPLLSNNFSEQRKLRIHNGFSHLWYEMIVENFV